MKSNPDKDASYLLIIKILQDTKIYMQLKKDMIITIKIHIYKKGSSVQQKERFRTIYISTRY